MKTELAAREALDIENRLLREMAARYARLIAIDKEKAAESPRVAPPSDGASSIRRKEPEALPDAEQGNQAVRTAAEAVRVRMLADGALSHQRKGLALNAVVGAGKDGQTVYWIRWAGKSLAVDESECVRLK